MTVTVGAVNDAPVANADTASTDEDTPVTIAVRGNDTDPENDPLTVTAVTQGTNGSVSIDPVTGNPVYTPNANWSGTDTFTYTIDDGNGGTDTATVTVTVGAVNDVPETAASNVVTDEDTVYVFQTADFDFSDVDSGDTLQAVRIDSLPLDGTLYLNGVAITSVGTEVTIDQINNNELTYLPDPNESGADVFGGTGEGDQQADYASFDFSVSDGTEWSASATITVDVTPVVDAPTLSLNDTSASDGSDLTDQITVPASVGMTQTVYSNIGLGGALLESVQLETISDGLSGGVTNIVTQPYRDGGNDVDNVDADSIQVTTGIIYLEAGDTLSFNGYNDDALLIEVGGETLIRTTGDAWGDYDTSYNGTINSTGNGAGTVETYGDFVASVSGYYTFEMYIYNHSGPGDLSVNAVLNGVETAFNTDNFTIYPDMASVDTAGGQHSGFVAGPEVGTDGGLYPVEINSGTEGMAIKLSSVTAALTDLDGSESLALTLSDIPAGSTVTDGTNTYTAPAASTGSVDMTGWDLDALSIIVPNVDATTTYTLQVTAVSTENATGDSASVQLPLQVTVYDSTTPLLSDNSADVYEAAMATGTDSGSTAEVATGNILADDTLPNGASLTNVTIGGGTTDSSVPGQITVTTAEGNTLVVDTATGDYTYTLINPVDHIQYVPTGNTVTLTSDTFTGVLDGWTGSNVSVSGDTLLIDGGGDYATKTFDFGAMYANQTVTVSFDFTASDRWDGSGSGDSFSVVVNGTQISNVEYGASQSASYDFTVTLDENGQANFVLTADTNRNNESASIDNFQITGPEYSAVLMDSVVDSFTYTVTNSDGMSYDATLDVTIHDDAPTATPQTIDVVVEPVTTNLTVVVDGSGSMDSTDLSLSMDAINALVTEYSALGDVNINIVQFFDGSATNTGWISSTSGVTLTSGGYTDIYQGLNSVVNDSYSGNQPKATQSVVYFFGDGDANVNVAAFDSYVANEWTQFVNSGTIDKLFTYSVNTTSVLADIEKVADNGENDVSPDAVNISNISQLSDAVGQTVGLFTEGSLTEDPFGEAIIDFGADGGHIASITIGANTVDYDAANVTQTVAGTHGDFEINFETGAFRYLANDTTDYTETVEATIADNDGDLLSGTVLLDINIQNAQYHAYDGTALDGGDGFDTITLAIDADLDFSGVSNIANIEKIDLSETGDHQLLNLNAQDVLDMTDADHELFIDGEAGDRVTIDSTLFHKTAADGSNETMEMNGHVYDVYTDSSNSLSLNIEQGIQVDPS